MIDPKQELQLADDIAECIYDSLGFVNYAYPWGSGELSGDGCDSVRVWQSKVLKIIDTHLQDATTRFDPLQIAVASGHGIGKSCLISMIVKWGLSTCDNCRIVVTANTENQLRTKTWPEVIKWSKLAINNFWFTPTATALISTDKDRSKSWRADAIPWSATNPEAFAGTHNKGKRLIIIFDEASAIDDRIWEVTEGALTDADTEIIWVAFGNPTRCEGRFHDCFGKYRHRWKTMQVDSRDVEGTNKDLFNKWVEDYGEDSDFVKVRVRGLFPSMSPDKLISQSMIDSCLLFEAKDYDWNAKVFGVDLARFGTNKNAVCTRQGRKMWPIVRWSGIDAMQTVSRIVELYEKETPDALFIDEGGLGGPIIDRLRQLIPKEKIFAVNFGSKAHKPDKYYNKRAEMWWDLAEAVREGLDMTKDLERDNDLLSVPYGFDGKQRIQLPKKEDLEFSPDSGDAMALTFAEPVIREKRKKKKSHVVRTGPWG